MAGWGKRSKERKRRRKTGDGNGSVSYSFDMECEQEFGTACFHIFVRILIVIWWWFCLSFCTCFVWFNFDVMLLSMLSSCIVFGLCPSPPHFQRIVFWDVYELLGAFSWQLYIPSFTRCMNQSQLCGIIHVLELFISVKKKKRKLKPRWQPAFWNEIIKQKGWKECWF